MPQPVPYVLPLEEACHFRRVQQNGAGQTSPAVAFDHPSAALFCRHRLEALGSLISPQSPIVIGVRKSLWPV